MPIIKQLFVSTWWCVKGLNSLCACILAIHNKCLQLLEWPILATFGGVTWINKVENQNQELKQSNPPAVNVFLQLLVPDPCLSVYVENMLNKSNFK